MGAMVLRGWVTTTSGERTEFAAGAREYLKAERAGIDPVVKPIEWTMFIAFEAIRREGGLVNVGFDAWAETVAEVEEEEDPESPAQPGD